MSSFLTPRYRATDDTGAPISGAKLYFYRTGTTTKLSTYSDEDLTSANSNPVVAGSDGFFGAIYLSSDAYTVLLTDSSDVTIWSADNVRSAVLSNNSLITRIGQIASNPIDYGAIGDGVSDEHVELQSAINAATGVVDLLGKTYKCSAALSVSSGITIRNGEIVFDVADNMGIYVSGHVDPPVPLTSNCSGSSVVLSSVSGFSSGDMVIITRPGYYCEVNSVTGVDVGTLTLSLRNSLQEEYTTTDASTCAKIIPIEQVRLENLVLTGPDSTSKLIDIDASRHVTIDGCTLTKDQYAVSVTRSQDVEFKWCHFSDCESGVRARQGCDGVSFCACKFRGSSGGNAIYIGEDEVEGIVNGERNTIVRDCEFVNFAYGIIAGTMMRKLSVDNCSFDSISTKPVFGDFNATTVQSIAIRGCHMVCGETSSIDVSANYGEYDIDGNIIRSAAGATSGCDVDITVSTAGTIRITNNRVGDFTGGGDFGDILANGTLVTITGNICHDITALGSVALVNEHNIKVSAL